ncbi:hypothetical protein CAAN3_03S09362 [[Candida] anglica]
MENVQLYGHGNISSTSVAPMPAAQVSSVGFNTLKKWNTGSSMISGNSSLNTSTTVTTQSTASKLGGGLSRIFTRNKSQQTIEPPPSFHREYRDNSIDEDEEMRFPSSSSNIVAGGDKKSIFKLPRGKLRLPRKRSGSLVGSGAGVVEDGGGPSSSSPIKGKSRTKGKPDLKVQTGGHHGLKVPKKILSAAKDGDSVGRKNSVNSPVSTFHSLFRSSISAQSVQAATAPSGTVSTVVAPLSEKGLSVSALERPFASPKDDPSSLSSRGGYHHHLQLPPTTANRTAIDLSSNNSNSFISDISFAMVYHFTDPDFSADTAPDDHTTFSDIHKKLLVPTDQFLSQRLGHVALSGNNGSAANLSSFGTPTGSSVGMGMSGSGGGPGGPGSYLGMSMGNPSTSSMATSLPAGLGIITDDEETYFHRYLIDFGKTNVQFFTLLLSLLQPLFLPSQQRTLANGSTHAYLGSTIEDMAAYVQDNYVKSGVDERQSPVASKRRTRPSRAVSAATASSALSDTRLDDLRVREIYQDLLTFFVKALIIYNEDIKRTSTGDDLLTGWRHIAEAWTYFNQRVRFSLMSIFYPLERFFNDVVSFSGTPIAINIERILLLAFRDAIIVPFLIRRSNHYQRKQRDGSATGDWFTQEEETTLKSNEDLLNRIIDCLGVVTTQTVTETGNSDGEEHIRTEVAMQTLDWITSI